MSDGTIHSIAPFMLQGIYLNPAFSYSCGFRFDVEVMDGFLTCVQRMVPSLQECAKISKEMEIYRMDGGTFGFDMAIQDRKTKMPGKLHFVSNFNVSSYFVSTFNFQISMSFLMFLLFVIDAWWTSYGARVPNLQKLSIQMLSQTCSSSLEDVSATGVYLRKYTPRSATS
jgi:hypothetical protein